MNKTTMMRSVRALALLAGGLLASQAMADGESLFNQRCSSCHGVGAVGIDGIAPPLKNPALWQQLGAQAPVYLAGVWAGGMSGKLEINGQTYIGLVMPPQTQIPPAELEQIGQYLLQKVNGTTQSVSQAQIEAARQAPPAHAQLRSLRKGG